MIESQGRRGRRAKILLTGLSLTAVVLTAGVVLAQDTPGATRRVLPPARVDWAAVAADYRRGAAPEARRIKGFLANEKGLDALPMPVLLPHASAQVTTATLIFMPYADGYDINMAQPQAPGVTILLSGSRLFVDATDLKLNLPKPDGVAIDGTTQSVFITQTETGQTATFSRYGMVYSIDVDCDGPAMGSAYCDRPDYIRSVAAAMSDIVLGEQAQGEMLKAANAAPPPDAGDATRAPRKDAGNIKTQIGNALKKAVAQKPVGK